jgi:hypothetical protein
MSDELQQLVQEMINAEPGGTPPKQQEVSNAPVLRYTPETMIDLMVQHPDWSHSLLAASFGRQPSWTSAVLASDAFQQALDSRRHEVADPLLSATLDERFRGLAIRAATVLQEKLNSSAVSDLVVLKAAELGIKALGMGQKQPEAPQLPGPQNSSQSVAEKLLAAMDARDSERDRQRTVDVEVVEVKDNGQRESN